MPNPARKGVVYIISNNKNKARSTRDEIKERLESKAEPYEGLGVDSISVETADNFAEEVLYPKKKLQILASANQMTSRKVYVTPWNQFLNHL